MTTPILNIQYKTHSELLLYRIKELKPLLKSYKLKVGGNKKTLVDRLSEFYESNKNKKNLVLKKKKRKIKLIQCENFQRTNYSNINFEDIKFTLKFHKLNSFGNKKKCFERLCQYFIIINKYKNQLTPICQIQQYYRAFIDLKIQTLKGPSFRNLSRSNNRNDFLSFDDISEINELYFFSFRDRDNFVYTFDIRSLNELLLTSTKNPYNRIEFSKETKEKIYSLLNLLKIKNVNLQFEDDEEEVEPFLLMTQRALEIFQKIDMLNNYTDVRWFLDLSTIQLKKLYKNAEDIWNYRAQLTHAMKKKIIPGGKAFKTPVWYVIKLHNKLELQNIILSEFDTFITAGEQREDKILGAMWMLTALVSVSSNAANAMPQYIQLN